MLTSACLCILLFAIVGAKPSDDNRLYFHSDVAVASQQWDDFKTKHGKEYATPDEEGKRRDIFNINLKRIAMHNYLFERGLKSFSMGVNEYTDMEREEFVSVMNGLLPRNTTHRITEHILYMSPLSVTLDLPEKKDWRTEGYVTPVKNQGHCGSCWSFSTTGALEGQHYRKTGRLVSLSEQNLVDCSAKWGNHGCNGGLMDNAFQYIKDNDGLDTETSYPYLAKEGSCHFKSSQVGATDAGYVDVVPRGDEEKLKEALATVGPISIAIDASHQSFQMYKSGVYDEPECSSQRLDHGVLLVGYGTMDGKDYWLVKNSWGENWGHEGYIYMSRNKDDQCGVASQASYPLV